MPMYEKRLDRIYIVWQIELGFLQEKVCEKSPLQEIAEPACEILALIIRQPANAQTKPSFNIGTP